MICQCGKCEVVIKKGRVKLALMKVWSQWERPSLPTVPEEVFDEMVEKIATTEACLKFRRVE